MRIMRIVYSTIHRISKLPSCKVEVSEGFGNFKLRTMMGERHIVLPWKIDEAGPAEVFNYCSSLVFLEPSIHFYWLIPAILFFLTILIAPASYRYIRLRKMLSKHDYKSKLTCSGLKLRGPMGNRKIGLVRLFLYVYCLASSTVDAYVGLDRFIGNNSMFAVTMWPGERVCSSNGFLKLTPKLIQLPLALEYNTGSWTHSRESSWGCVAGSCPNEQECAEMRTEIPIMTDNKISRSFCDNFPKSCAFGHGCWYGKDIVSN